MNQGAATFRSSGRRGFSPQILSLPGLTYARKVPGEVDVRFAIAEDIVQSREGKVPVHAGDAVLTGRHGEHWRVSRANFHDKYAPVPPTLAGTDGRYAALPIRVAAVQMREPFEVILADEESVLTGTPGDWLVDYGDGSLGVVAPEVFSDTYRLGA